jgi:Holliday junction resolvase
MANRNKQRGYELERETVLFWQEEGAEVRRVFGSGAYKHAGDDFEGDVKLGPYTVEAKRKKSGYKFLYDALDQGGINDMLVVRQDKARRLYVLEETTLVDLMGKAGLLSNSGK